MPSIIWIMSWDGFKKGCKKVWYFLWEENSVLSWIVNIIIAFVLIKFLIYPGLGLALGTNLPIVAVVSESMEHNGNFDFWWNSPAYCGEPNFLNQYTLCTQAGWYAQKNMTKEMFLKYPMHNGFNKGDIIILKGITYDKIQKGDIIVFQSQLPYPVIHRVVEKNDVIQTKGDHNQAQLNTATVNEMNITKDVIIGEAWLKIPFLGYVKIWFVDFLQCITLNGCSFN